MALIFRHVFCPGCGTRHNFGVSAGGWDPDTPFEYVCPQTGRRAEICLPLTATAEEVHSWVQGAVALTPLGAQAHGTPVGRHP